MGMFDYINYEANCPKCGIRIVFNRKKPLSIEDYELALL